MAQLENQPAKRIKNSRAGNRRGAKSQDSLGPSPLTEAVLTSHGEESLLLGRGALSRRINRERPEKPRPHREACEVSRFGRESLNRNFAAESEIGNDNNGGNY